jgi:phospholipid/cholesterol/gamma-HCH transport system substrate-binding protein
MNNMKFNKYERIAGLFVVIACAGAVAATAVAAIKKGWFATKVPYSLVVGTADGLRIGTPVTISGFRAGEVSDVELMSAEKIVVHLELVEKYAKEIHEDAQAMIIRPFIFGDKTIEITVGSESAAHLPPHSVLKVQATMDIMDLVSGKTLGPVLGTLEGLMANMSRLAQAFADPKRTEAFVKMFDRMDPLIVNMSKMSIEVTKLTGELNQFVPQLRQESPQIGTELSQLVGQLHRLTTTIEPVFKDIGPDLPRVSRRAIEALDEVVVTLKAMEKSFFLRGNVKDVKEEEVEQRKPANK